MTRNGKPETPISAMLARRLAGAASGYADGKKIWFTARYRRDDEFSFRVSEPIVSDERPAEPADDELGLFGPFLTPQRRVAAKRTPVVRVYLELEDGKTITLDAKHADCVFWSEAALEKFAIPYYASLGDLELAQEIRTRFRKPDVVALDHGPNTEYTLRRTEDDEDGINVMSI